MLPLLAAALATAAPGCRAPGLFCSSSGSVEARSRYEARALHSRPSSRWMAASSSDSATACPGLTAAALPHSSAANFHQLCRVVGGKWSVISAGILFDLCRNLPTDDAQAALAFQQIIAAANMPDAADIITRAASTHKSYGSFAAADPKTAGLIHRAAQIINTQRGGLYEGKMD